MAAITPMRPLARRRRNDCRGPKVSSSQYGFTAVNDGSRERRKPRSQEGINGRAQEQLRNVEAFDLAGFSLDQ